MYFVKLPLVFVCSYTSTLRVCVKATDPPAGAETCSDTDPASTQTIVLNSSSSKSDIALAFSSHGFHTTKIKSKLHCILGKLFLVHTVLLRYIKHVLFPFEMTFILTNKTFREWSLEMNVYTYLHLEGFQEKVKPISYHRLHPLLSLYLPHISYKLYIKQNVQCTITTCI